MGRKAQMITEIVVRSPINSQYILSLLHYIKENDIDYVYLTIYSEDKEVQAELSIKLKIKDIKAAIEAINVIYNFHNPNDCW